MHSYRNASRNIHISKYKVIFSYVEEYFTSADRYD